MVDKKLIEYIRENLQKGHSLEEIRKFIVNYGWSDKDFDKAVLLASGSPEKTPEKGKKPEEGEEKEEAHFSHLRPDYRDIHFPVCGH